MTKLNFLMALHEKLADLPQSEVEERLVFYSEMIEDRMEEGLSEAEAVSAVGAVEEIAAQIAAEIPSGKVKKKRKAWKTVLLIVGSPLWGSLLVAAVAVVFAVYVSLWAVAISLWACFGASCGCALGGLVASVIFFCGGTGSAGFSVLGASLVCAGLSVFLFYGCKAATKGVLWLGKKLCLWAQKCFSRKEAAK